MNAEVRIPVSSLKPEGIALKGCSYIYAPAGQAGEYAPLAANPYRGCGLTRRMEDSVADLGIGWRQSRFR